MRRSEREAMKRRWHVECRRSVPSSSATFRYLERFHDPEEESRREPRTAFIPAASAGLRGLMKVNADMVGFAQEHLRHTHATLDMDATLIETHKRQALYCYKKYKAYQPLTTYWAEQEAIVHSEFRDGNVAQDPAMRVIAGWRGPDKPAASTNSMSRFETEVLTRPENLEGLARLNARWVQQGMARTPHRRVILDMDSSESPVHGEQEGTAYNGHFSCACYHPIFVFNQFGDCEGAKLRPGNVHSAHGWLEVLEPIVARYEQTGVRRYFRADAAFAKPDMYKYVEDRRVLYAIRLPSNEVLQWEIAPLFRRPVGRPPKEPIIWHEDYWYQAGSWDRPRRVVAKVEWHQGELFPRVGFIVTHMSAGPEGVVHFYNGRGTAEQWIKEGKYALNWTRLSCHRFVANQVRLALFILAYNPGNFLRRLCLPNAVKHWSLRSLQMKLIKIGGRLVRHARRLVFQLAEVAVPRVLFQGVLDRIGRLHAASG